MAGENVNSSVVTNVLTTSTTVSEMGKNSGRVRVVSDSIALLSTSTELADTVTLAALPSNARILQIWLAADDLDSNTTPLLTWNLGLWQWTAADGLGVVSDVDVFAAAITTGQAATGMTQYNGEGPDALFVSGGDNRLWEIDRDGPVGPSTLVDDGRMYAIVAEVNAAAATGAAGDLYFQILYTVD